MSITLPYRLTRPPQAIRTAALDTIALVPASLLLHKGKYKAIASTLPTGSVFICIPSQPKQRRALAKVASYFRSRGHQVTTLPSAQFAMEVIGK